MFNYIEMFYNSARKPVRNGMLAPVELEWQQILKAEGVKKLGAIQCFRMGA